MSKSIDEQLDEIMSEIEIEYWPEEGDMSLDSRSVSSATKSIKALINQARIDELGYIKLNYGNHEAETYINGKPQSIPDRIAELKEEQ